MQHQGEMRVSGGDGQPGEKLIEKRRGDANRDERRRCCQKSQSLKALNNVESPVG